LDEYPVRLLREMLETYTPSGSEESLARFLKTELESLGFNPRIDVTGNVVAEAGSDGPEILLCGHMDTVPGQIPFREEGGYLYGRGAVDAKSSLATLVMGASRALAEERTPFRVRIACVVEEETSSRGFRSIVAKGPIPQYAIFGEPSGLTSMIVGYKGRIQVQIECITDGGHSASPWLSRNSAEEAFTFWTSLRDTLLDNQSVSRFNTVTGSLTRVATTGPENSVPSETRLTIDIRTPPQTDANQIMARIESLIGSYCSERPELKLQTTLQERSQAYLANPHSKLVSACRTAIRKTTGEVPALVKKTGTSDMNLLPPETVAISYGPGDSRLDHTDKERISIAEYLKSIEVCAETLKLLSVHVRPETQVTA
jgi:[amino group carrier protein]-lysine/ornithine hydrolase